MKHFHLYCSSSDSSHTYPYNSSNDFIVDLNREIDLEGHGWEVALSELTYQGDAESATQLLVCCDLVVESFVEGRYVTILRRINVLHKTQVNMRYVTLQYIPLKGPTVKQLRIYITDLEGRPSNIGPNRTLCTLHFRQSPQHGCQLARPL